MGTEDNKDSGNIYDRIFKENAEAIFMPLVIEYFNLDISEYKVLPTKFPKTMEREVDYLFEITSSTDDKWILHLEFQAQSSKDIVYRMGVYHSLILQKYKLPVRHVVIYLGKHKTSVPTQLDEEEVFTEYKMIKVNELDVDQLLSSQVPEVVILSLLSNYDKEQTERILRLIFRKLKDYERRGVAIEKYVKQLILLSRLRNIQFTHKIMEDMVIEYEIENDYLYKKGVKEGRQEGIKEGEIKGEKRGFRKGKQEGILSLATAMKNNGEPLEKIMLYTSLTKEEVEEL